MQPTKTVTIDWDGESDLNVEALIVRELVAGWKMVNKGYGLVAGQITFEFEPYPIPTGEHANDYYDREDGEDLLSSAPGVKSAWWHKQQRNKLTQ